ncbi:hypothetical protein B7Y94_00535 [Candidatus Saccharibacteria bacterium 32-49-12]|nr:MAG: hypothetical protein B7Y94_00535 [Candidatus Saccharibacteria bacterium 32-49-12]
MQNNDFQTRSDTESTGQPPLSAIKRTDLESSAGLNLKNRRRNPLRVFLALLALAFGFIAVIATWYFLALRPVNVQGVEQKFTVNDGATVSGIGDELERAGLIRSRMAFLLTARLNRSTNDIQAGQYSLSPALSTGEVIEKLTKGPEVEVINITFLPGGTLEDHKKVLLEAGYDEAAIDQAFIKQYDHPLFEAKPASADLEGYIYGETHQFNKGAPLESVLVRYFDDFYKVIKENQLVDRYSDRGLNLFEGITLASIIEREVSCGSRQICEDQAKVAQVFFKRLDEGIPLGADATFIYAARKAGRAPAVDFDSPYNTRLYRGLPPGPISSPGLGALLAVADPAEGDYLFFVSGDDGVNYFSRTEAEHIENTRRYCIENCRLPQ